MKHEVGIRKGVATDLYFRLVSNTDATGSGGFGDNANLDFQQPITGAVNGHFTKRLSKDGGAPTTIAGTVTEVGNGIYRLPLSANETDASLLIVYLTCSLTATINSVARNTLIYENPIVVYTDPDWDTKVFGSGFVAATGSLMGIKLGITNAQIPIVRDD